MQEIRLLMREMFRNPLHLIVIGIIGFLALGTAALSLLLQAVQVEWFPGYLQNLSTEMCGALLVFFLIELFLTHGRELQQINQDLRSTNNTVALSAIERMRANGMLFDGTLERQAFWGANWENADLSDAVLPYGSLASANLKGVNLQRADIRGVDFSWAKFDETTILPDGTHWKADGDLDRFRKL